MCLCVDLIGFLCLGPCACWTWRSVSFPRLGKLLAPLISSNKFSTPFSFFYFWDAYNVNVRMFWCLTAPLTCPCTFLFFLLFAVQLECFLLLFQIAGLFSASCNQLLIPFSIFYFTYCIPYLWLVPFYIFFLFVEILTEFIHSQVGWVSV